MFGREVNGQHQRQSAWAVQRIRLEIAYILRDQFRDRADVAVHLQETIKRGQSAEIVALSLFNPGDPLLDQIQAGPMAIGQQDSDWVTALHLAAVRSDAKDFVAVTSAMINRPSHGIWSFQDVTNRAVVERLRCDPDAVRLVKDRLAGSPSTSEVASLPRYLSAAGTLDEEVHQRCATLLQQEAREPLPRAGYDAVDELDPSGISEPSRSRYAILFAMIGTASMNDGDTASACALSGAPRKIGGDAIRSLIEAQSAAHSGGILSILSLIDTTMPAVSS